MRREMHSIETIRPADVERKQKLHREGEKRLAILTTIADVLAGAALSTAGESDPSTALTARIEADADVIVELVDALETPDEGEAQHRASIRAQLRLDAGRPGGAPSRNPLHWPIAFPEVFVARDRKHGFDAMVGNPPFIGGQKITGAAGTDYRNHVLTWIGGGVRGSADLVAYFFLNATKTAKSLGLLATNTIAQGDTSEVGLTQIIDTGWKIHRAISSTTWPGDATLEIAKVWATAHPWHGQHVLDGRPAVGIDEMLYPQSRSGWRKQRLAHNADRSFIGSYVLGTEGFTMSPEEAQALIDKDPKNADVLRPYLGGEDLNQSPTQTAPRWIINFFDWPEEKARRYPDCFSIVHERIRPERAKVKDAQPDSGGATCDLVLSCTGRSSRSTECWRSHESARRSSQCSCRRGRCSQMRPSFLPTTTTFISVCSPAVSTFAGRYASHPRCGRIPATRPLMCSRPFPNRRTTTPSRLPGRLWTTADRT